MRVFFVTRHPGACEWGRTQGLDVSKVVPHLDPNIVARDDIVVGSLPVNLAAEVCARGARYLHLSLDLPAHMRGQELTADRMKEFGARLEEYLVKRVAV